MHTTSRIIAIGAVCMLIAGCKVEKTQEGKLPAVHVSGTGGQLPKFSVQGPKVEVGSKTESINVPTIHVKKAQ